MLRDVQRLERRAEREREPERQRLARQLGVRGRAQLISFSNTPYLGSVCFSTCPNHPPNIRPISSNLSEIVTYFFVSIDLDSNRIKSSSLRVSNLRIARRRYGDLSFFGKNVAAETASIISIHKVSIRTPKL